MDHLNATIKKEIDKQVEKNWEEQIDFLQKIGSYKSTLHNEGPLQNFIHEYFQENMKLKTEKITPDNEEMSKHKGYSPVDWDYDHRPVIVGTWPTEEKEPIGRSLILQGHMDVVPEGPLDDWKYDPWAATIEGNKMYGRGIQDMKSGFSAIVFAIKALQSLGYKPLANVYLQSVIEEEITGNGALATLISGYKADAALIPEPFDEKAVISQVGVIWIRVSVKGLASHVEKADSAVNAIEKATVLIRAIQDYREYINNQPKHRDFKKHDHPLNVNIGKIVGGDWVSSVPSKCTFEARIGIYPGEKTADIKRELVDWIHKYAQEDEWLKEEPPEISFIGFDAEGVSIDKDQEVFQTLEKSHKIVTGHPMEYTAITATTDIRFYNLYHNIPATCYGPKGGNMHGPNEWVDLDSVKQTTKVYADFIARWCRVKR